MRALVIDDELLVLEGLEAFLLAALPELSLDKTPHVQTAVRLARSIHYEIVLLDWHLVDERGAPINGRSVVSALNDLPSKPPILVVSGDERIDWPKTVMELELAGVVPKSASGATLLDAIQVALRGGIFLPSRTRSLRGFPPSDFDVPCTDPRSRFPELTERQAEVFQIMMKGRSDKQIARDLGISETTVKSHVRGILAVVGVHRRGEAIFQMSASGGALESA